MDENVALRKSRFRFHRDDLVENAADSLDRLRFFNLISENFKRDSFVEPAAQQKAEEKLVVFEKQTDLVEPELELPQFSVTNVDDDIWSEVRNLRYVNALM